MSRTLISLSGKLQAGKDSVADVLVEEYNFTKLSFAKNLKALCRWVFNLKKYDTDTQEGKTALFETPIKFNKAHFNLILNWMNNTHSLKSAEDKIKTIKEKYVGKLYFKTTREILQLVGFEVCRGICPSYHLDIVEEKVVCNRHKNYTITDARFPNEREMLKKHGAVLCLIKRPSLEISSKHASETSLGVEADYDFCIENYGTLTDLKKLARQLILDINLICEK